VSPVKLELIADQARRLLEHPLARAALQGPAGDDWCCVVRELAELVRAHDVEEPRLEMLECIERVRAAATLDHLTKLIVAVAAYRRAAYPAAEPLTRSGVKL
jgi:hypothetical protein